MGKQRRIDGGPRTRYTSGVKKVVVIDDDDELRDMICVALGGRYEVSSAHDGARGLEVVRAVRPDLLVLDLLMPVMHGFEVCRRLRADPEIKSVKILIITSKSYQNDVRTVIEEAGADGCLLKPFKLAEFNRRVDEMAGGA